MQLTKYTITAFILLLTCCTGCEKWLDAKPDKKLAVPSSVKDLQALLDNNGMMNRKGPTYDEASADNYYYPREKYLEAG